MTTRAQRSDREFDVTPRGEIRHTVTDEAQVDDDIRYLPGLRFP